MMSAQLAYHQHVLTSVEDKKLYFKSHKGVNFSGVKLKANLLSIVRLNQKRVANVPEPLPSTSTSANSVQIAALKSKLLERRRK